MTRLHATAAHTIPERPPIQVTPGQQVQAGQRDTDWPAFVFITTDDGAGWVPERHLDTSSDPAVVITGYDTTELATAVGHQLFPETRVLLFDLIFKSLHPIFHHWSRIYSALGERALRCES